MGASRAVDKQVYLVPLFQSCRWCCVAAVRVTLFLVFVYCFIGLL